MKGPQGLTLQERIENLSIPEPNSGCWLWMGSLNALGYGSITMRPERSKLAHRMSWAAFRGPILGGQNVLHKCDVRCCVNPEHLFLGSHSDNMKDMYAKGRHRIIAARTKATKGSRLTDDEVRQIRSTPKHTRGVAKKFGISRDYARQIRNLKHYKHIPK